MWQKTVNKWEHLIFQMLLILYKTHIYSSANKVTGLDTVVQEIADFCDDRDETRFGEDYYVLDMR